MLSFIFTEDSFRADIPEGHETQREQKYREAFARDRYR